MLGEVLETVMKEWAVAVVVHYGDLHRTVEAVLSHSALGVFSNIVVVANDSSDRPEELKDVSCIWLKPGRNIGFGGACQLGAGACDARIYAFFNPHVRIDRASAESCLAAFEAGDVGIAAPYIYHPGRGKTDFNWRYAHCIRTYSPVVGLPVQIPLDQGINHSGGPLAVIDNDWATGGIVFCRYEVIKNIGWDGSYFLTFEDVDISMRAKRSGWRVVVVTSAVAFHSGEATKSSTAASYYGMRNAIWFARRHHSCRIRVMLTAYLLMLLCRIAAADVLKRRRPGYARAAARGIVSGWALWPDGVKPLPGEPFWPSD